MLPEAAELLKKVGNQRLFENRYSEAITAYSDAIQHAPASAQLHALRSDALLKRNWDGDAWFALEDANRALYLDPRNLKAHSRAVSSLRGLGQLKVGGPLPGLSACLFPVPGTCVRACVCVKDREGGRGACMDCLVHMCRLGNMQLVGLNVGQAFECFMRES